MKRFVPGPALRIAVVYILISAVWIYTSDQALLWLLPNAPWAQTYKGWFFVLVTGGLLYLAVRQELGVRRHTEEALQQANEQLKAVLNALPDMMFVVNSAGYIFDYATRDRGRLFLPPEQFIGKTVEEVMPAEAAATIMAALKEAAEKGTHAGATYSLETPEGEGWYELSAAAAGEARGSDARLVVLVRNITARKLAEQRLRESESKFAAAFHVSPVAKAIGTWDGLMAEVNPAWEEMLGFTSEEAIGKTSTGLGIVDVQTRERFIEALKDTGKVLNTEVTLHTKEGRTVDVLFSVNEIMINGVPHRMSTMIDISDRVEALRKLRESEERFRRVVEAMPGVVVMIDGQGSITLITHQITEMFGYNPDELMGQSIEMLLPENHHKGHVRFRKGYFKKPGPRPMGEGRDLAGLRKDGTTFPIEIGLDFTVIDGKPHALAFITDITERKRAEEALHTLNMELEQRVRDRTAELEIRTKEMETFTYSVSHDLKAPLRGIDGYSRLLMEDYADRLDDDGKSFVTTIRHAAVQMSRLIDDLLAYSRLERRQLEMNTVDPHDLAQALVAEKANEIEEQKASVAVNIPFREVRADPDGLAMALRNLIDNAIKFARKDEPSQVEIGGSETPSHAIIWVKDNGIGFDMKFHDRIFSIFQRLHRAEEYPGTGVGLAIVQKAMERMGGSARAESHPGQGATFFLELPK